MTEQEKPKRRDYDLNPLHYLIGNENFDAHIISNIMRIDSIKEDLEEFKTDTKTRLSKIEGWIFTLVGIAVSTLIAIVGALLTQVF
jgi:hypothetical protein